MAYSAMTDEQVDANSPINETLTKDKIKNNDDDHETRIVTLEGNATNWTSQLGTLITDTDMGEYTGNLLTDDQTAKENIQQLADTIPFIFPTNTVITTEYTDNPATWTNLGSSFTITAYSTINLGCHMRCNLDADQVDQTIAGSLRLKISNATYGAAYYIEFEDLNGLTNWPISSYTTYYNFATKPICLYGSGTVWTIQPQWIVTSTVNNDLQIKNRTFYFSR